MTEKLKQLQQEHKRRMKGFEVWREASAEAKEAAMVFLQFDIELTESLLEIGLGSEASSGSRMPGNTIAAEIARDMRRNVERAVKAAKWDMMIARKEADGERVSPRLARMWRKILDS